MKLGSQKQCSNKSLFLTVKSKFAYIAGCGVCEVFVFVGLEFHTNDPLCNEDIKLHLVPSFYLLTAMINNQHRVLVSLWERVQFTMSA